MTRRGSCFSSPRSVPVNASPPQPPSSLPLPQPAPAPACTASGGTAVPRRGRDGGGGRWLFFRRSGWRRLRAGSPVFSGGPSGSGAWPGPWVLATWSWSGQFRIGGSVDSHNAAGRLAAIPGVRIGPRSAVSSTTSSPSLCPPPPQRPQRETPSARTVLRKRRILSRNRRSCLHIPNAVSASALDDSPRFRPGRSARVPPMDHPTYLASRTRARARA